MSNSKTNVLLQGGGVNDKYAIIKFTLISDGTQETNTIIYQNSTYIKNVAKGNLMEVWCLGNGAGVARLNWDQSTPAIACSLSIASCRHQNFRSFGGIHNPNGSGATGNLTLTTTGLAAASEFTLILVIAQN